MIYNFIPFVNRIDLTEHFIKSSVKMQNIVFSNSWI